MSQTLELPASLRDYMLKPGVRTAVDHLLEQKADHFPADLQWSEVLNYHDGLLLAAKVRRDYVEVLLCAWEMVWADVLVGGGFAEVPFADYVPTALPAPSVVWDDSLYRVYSLPGREEARLYTAVALLHNEGLVAYVAADDENDKNLFADDRFQVQRWVPDNAGYWRTLPKAGPLDANGCVDVGPLKAAAEEALRQLTS